MVRRDAEGGVFKTKNPKTYSRYLICQLQPESAGDKHLIPDRRVDFSERNFENSTIDTAGNDRTRLSSKHG